MDDRDTAQPRRPLREAPRITAALVDFCLHVDDRTEIRLLRTTDAAILYDVTVRNREHLAPWMAWIDRVIDVSDTYAFLRDAETDAYEHRAFKAGIWRGDELLGAIDLHAIDWENGIAGIGYWLDEAHTGQGLMTEAVRVLVEYAFEALDLHRLEIRAATANRKSRHIPERLGFRLEGELREVQLVRGVYHDHALYALIRE